MAKFNYKKPKCTTPVAIAEVLGISPSLVEVSRWSDDMGEYAEVVIDPGVVLAGPQIAQLHAHLKSIEGKNPV